MKLSNAKIEDRALGALNRLVDEHSTMQCILNKMDKEMSWDGYFLIYNSLIEQDKEHFDDKIPTQVKGHIDQTNKYMNQNKVKYSVSLADLRIYFRDRGVVYFIIFMSKDGKKKEIFYSSLFPTKIKNYLEKAKRKGNTSSCTIRFSKMEQSSEALYRILKQFSIESRQQGFGLGPNVKNVIAFDDFNRIESVHFTAIGVTNIRELMNVFGNGDVSLYGKYFGYPVELPIEWYEESVFSIKDTVSGDVRVGDRIFYKDFTREYSSNDNCLIHLSDNLTINLHDAIIKFTPNTNVFELKKDLDFMYAIKKYGECYICGSSVRFNDLSIPNDFTDYYAFYTDLCDALDMINFDYDKPFKVISDKEKRALMLLVKIKNGEMDKLSTEDNRIINWELDGKCFPIAFFRNKNDNKIILKNFLYDHSLHFAISDGKENHYKIPGFIILEKKILCNLYDYNEEGFKQQINDAIVNENTLQMLNHGVLQLLNIYDTWNRPEFLMLARLLIEKIRPIANRKDFFILNDYQIKYRENGLSQEDKSFLLKFNSKETQSLFAKYVLLEQKKEAEKYFSKMSKENINIIKEFPIMTLFKKLKM